MQQLFLIGLALTRRGMANDITRKPNHGYLRAIAYGHSHQRVVNCRQLRDIGNWNNFDLDYPEQKANPSKGGDAKPPIRRDYKDSGAASSLSHTVIRLVSDECLILAVQRCSTRSLIDTWETDCEKYFPGVPAHPSRGECQ